MSVIVVAKAAEVNGELLEAMAALVPQLSPRAAIPSASQLQTLLDSDSTTLLLARDLANGNRIVGMLTLAVFQIPTGARAWIEDVVVDKDSRGRGIGKQLTRSALELALNKDVRTVDLTSRPARKDANALYKGMGFTIR